MSRLINFNKSAFVFIFSIVAIACASGDGLEEKQVITRDTINLTIPNPFGEKPIFETNDQNGRYIGIHIPVLFDLDLHYRGGFTNTLVKTSLVSGLMRLNYDRLPGPDGQKQGPIQFSILGMSLYDNKETPNA